MTVSKAKLGADMTLPPEELPDDPRLMQAVQDYLRQLESGQLPNRQELMRRYPDLAGPLAQCLDGLELVHKAAAQPKNSLSAPTTPSLGSGETLPIDPLGDFKIVREIGRGGMGIVYEAVQMSLGRRVALKVLPFAATFDTKHLQRFHNEAHAAAQLHHTNIVPVYAVGCERGVHFYAMQLIEGQTLAEVLQQIRGQEAEDRSQAAASYLLSVSASQGSAKGQDLAGTIPTETVSALSMALTTQRSRDQREFYRAAARFMVQAAGALDHAHQFGIVHRDIKPANLLVDVHGRLWVADFGLAQFHDELGLTKTGDILGTLRYMSPEQASGQRVLLDHRTDVYSLGATLYELVTLQPIFPGQNQQDLLRQILHEEPRTPRSIDAAVPIELETIILKATSKNPAERYSSAKELAEDLKRFLADEPIQAKRPSVVERVRKWSRRHPAFVRAALVLLICGAVGLAISTAMIAREQGRTKTAYKDLEQEQGRTLKRAEEAEERFRMARRSADEMIRIAQEEAADNPAVQPVRRRLLETALVFYQELIELRAKDPSAQAELAATRDDVKKILDDLAVLQGAGQHNLLKHRTVHDDLDLRPDQRDRLNELWREADKQLQQSFSGFGQLSADERNRRFLELARINEAAIADILEPAQQKRLKQIALQLRGPLALVETEVATPLKLTPDQKKQIRSLESALRFEKPPFDPKGPPGKWFEDRRRTAMKQAETLLTTEQARLWKEMIGPAFTGPGPMFLPPGPMFGDFGPPPPKGKKKDGPPPKKF